MPIPDDVVKEGDAARILLVRQAFLTKAPRHRVHAEPTEVGDDAHGLRLRVKLPRPSPYPNANASATDKPLFMRLTSNDTHANVAS